MAAYGVNFTAVLLARGNWQLECRLTADKQMVLTVFTCGTCNRCWHKQSMSNFTWHDYICCRDIRPTVHIILHSFVNYFVFFSYSKRVSKKTFSDLNAIQFYVVSGIKRICKFPKIDTQPRHSFCLSTRKKFVSHWTDFINIQCWGLY